MTECLPEGSAASVAEVIASAPNLAPNTAVLVFLIHGHGDEIETDVALHATSPCNVRPLDVVTALRSVAANYARDAVES